MKRWIPIVALTALCAQAAQAQDRPAGPTSLEVVAANPWNDSGLDVAAGARLSITAAGTWRDATIDSSPDGYERWYMKFYNGVRRAPHDHWFTLIGCVGRTLDHCFTVGSKTEIAAPVAGRLYFFANDVNGFYWNNSGRLRVTISTLRSD